MPCPAFKSFVAGPRDLVTLSATRVVTSAACSRNLPRNTMLPITSMSFPLAVHSWGLSEALPIRSSDHVFLCSGIHNHVHVSITDCVYHMFCRCAHWRSNSGLIGIPDSCYLLAASAAIPIATTTVGLPVTWLSTTITRVSVLVLALAAACLCLPFSVTDFSRCLHTSPATTSTC